MNLAYRMKACNKCHWYAIGVFMHGGAWTFENHLNCFSTFGLTAVGIKDIKRAYRFLLTRSLPSERDYLQAVFDIISSESLSRPFCAITDWRVYQSRPRVASSFRSLRE